MEKSTPQILVTGSEGFIGSNLMRELPAGTIGLDKKSGNNILDCDLPDADIVIHLAAEPGVVQSVASPYSNAETNILGTIRLAERYKDSRFIFASSGGAIQETIESPYGLSKKACEEYIKLLMKDYVIVRFPNVYGEGSRSVVDKFLRGESHTIYGNGASMRIYGHISDIVRAIKLAMDWEPGLYKLGTNQRYSMIEIAQAVGQPYDFGPERKGEITHTGSRLPNETPNWQAAVQLNDYIYENKHRNPQ